MGRYSLGLACAVILIGCFSACAGAAGASGAGATAANSATGIAVSPAAISLQSGATQQFTANSAGVTWSVNGKATGNTTIGTISASGLYAAPSAPPTPSTVTITATLQSGESGSATATVTGPHSNQNQQAFPISLGTGGGNVGDVGSSGGTNYCCSGTLGALVSRGGQQFILSANHVLDRSDQGTPGDSISQPGLADVDCDSTRLSTVAHLAQAADLQTSNVDAALATVVTGAVDVDGSILDLGGTNGTSVASAPPASTLADPSAVLSTLEPVAKSGDATGLTCSVLQSISTDVQVDYQSSCGGPTAFSVTFSNQVIVQGGDFSAAGDSGSLIVTADTSEPVALLFAGNSTSSTGNPLQDVLAALRDPTTSAVPVIVGGSTHATACLNASSASQSATSANQAALPQSEIARAQAVKEAASTQLLGHSPAVAVDIGASLDAPGEAAFVIQVNGVPQPGAIPPQVDGVRTRIVPVQMSQPSAQSSPSAAQTELRPVTHEELSRSLTAKMQYAKSLMAQTGVIGVGTGLSYDSPGESAVIVYLENGTAPASIPPVLGGVRTRIVMSDRFRSYGWGRASRPVCSAKKSL